MKEPLILPVRAVRRFVRASGLPRPSARENAILKMFLLALTSRFHAVLQMLHIKTVYSSVPLSATSFSRDFCMHLWHTLGMEIKKQVRKTHLLGCHCVHLRSISFVDINYHEFTGSFCTSKNLTTSARDTRQPPFLKHRRKPPWSERDQRD